MTASDCILKVFKAALFQDDRTILNEEELRAVHLEYVDLAGLTKTRELELNAQLYSLQNRVEKVKWLIYSLRISVNELPLDKLLYFTVFKQDIEKLKGFGHKLYWDGNLETFMSMLDKIETKEKKYSTLLTEKEKEVVEFYKAQAEGEVTVKQSRHNFIKNEIELRKRGHQITDDTTVEVFALIIKAENDAAEKSNFNNDQSKRTKNR